MKISLNGAIIETSARTVSELLAEQQTQKPFVVAVNGDFLPKPEYPQTSLKENDKLDIVVPVFGG